MVKNSKLYQKRFVNFQFIDILGNLREKLVPSKKYYNYIGGLSFDGSSISGYTEISKSDLMLMPDLNSKYRLYDKDIIFCEADYPTDSRKILKSVLNEFCKETTVYIGTELEFFLFEKNGKQIITENLDNKKYLSEFSTKTTRFFEEVVDILNELKFNVECVHHECGRNQYELDFKFDEPLKTADRIIIIKQILKKVAEKYNLYVSFMPKPICDMAGSGMHINLSVFKGKKNLFEEDNELSQYAHYFMNGIIEHIKSITAFANPLINSYKRLHSGFEAPNKIGWSELDRNVMIRVPKAFGVSKRIELRSPDISCNPYLTFATIILSGFDGVEKKVLLSSTEKKSYYHTKKMLPKDLKESLGYLKNDKLFKNYFKEAIEKYIGEKQKEISEFSKCITDWEIKKYL